MTLEELEELDSQQDLESNEADEPTADVDTEEADTDVETPESDVETTHTETADTTPETPDYVELFKESGLEKQYPGGLPELLNRVPETNRYVRTLQEENKQFKDALLERARPAVEPEEDVYVDPDLEDVLKSKGFINQSTIDATNERLSNVENSLLYNKIANVVDGYEEIKDVAKTLRTQKVPLRGENAVWDRLNDLSDQFSGLENVPFETKLALLYDRAKSDVVKPDKTKPPVKPLSAQQKMAAQTAKLKTSTSGTADYAKMSSDEVLKHAQEHGLYEY